MTIEHDRLRAERTRHQSRLKVIASELSQLAALESPTEQQNQRWDTLAAESVTLESRVSEINDRLKGTRLTQPNRIPQPGDSRRNSMTATATSNDTSAGYCKLHGLKPEALSDGNFKSFGDFLATLGSGRYDERIQALSVAASGSNFGSGGVMVPERFLAESLHPPGEAELVLPRARLFPMNEGTLNVSALDALDETDGTMFGGFVSEWIAENGEFTARTPKTTRITLTRKKLGIFTVSSNELVSDSAYESQLVPAMAAAIADFRDQAFFTGNGVGKPRGILSDPALVVVAKETGQAAATITSENLDKMYSRLHPRLVRNAEWFCSPTCIPQLLRLTRTVGTAGQVIPVLNEVSGGFYLYGLPLHVTSKLPTLGNQGDVLLADLSQYGVGMSRGIAIDRSEHARFERDQIAWRAVFRCDGQGLWRGPFKPRNGDTLSWCVTLAERA